MNCPAYSPGQAASMSLALVNLTTKSRRWTSGVCTAGLSASNYGHSASLERNGEWEIPEEEKGLHASGHACGPDLLRVAREIQPEVLIPVHSEKPEFYVDNLSDSGIKVILPAEDGTIEI